MADFFLFPCSTRGYHAGMATVAALIFLLVVLVLILTGAGIFAWTLQWAAILLAAAGVMQQGTVPRRVDIRHLWSNPIVLLLLYTLLMLVPLPSLLYRLSPQRAAAHEQVIEAHEVVEHAFDTTFPSPNGFALSRNHAGTIRFLLWLIAGFSAWTITRYAPTGLRTSILQFLLLIAVGMALAGIAGKWIFPQGDTLYWYLPVPHGRPGPMGGFMNRNHFAGYMALLAPAALASSIQALLAHKWAKMLLWSTLTAVLVLAVLLSFSRGGTLALLAGLTGTTGFMLRKTTHTHKIQTASLLVLFLVATTATIMMTPRLQQRLASWRNPATTASLHTRIQAWGDALETAKAYPVLGAGPNAYKTVLPQHRVSSERVARDFAENEYVQWLVETGMAGLLLLGLLVFRIGKALARPPSEQPVCRWHQAAAAGALAAAAVHACVDFPLRLPLYVVVLGALLALLWPVPPADKHLSTLPKPHLIPLLLGFALALCLLPMHLQLDAPARISTAPPHVALRALHAAPTYPIVWRRLAAILWAQDTPTSRKTSVGLLSQAVHYDPNHYVLWRLLGERRLAIGDRQGAAAAYSRAQALRHWVRIPTSLQKEK